jgi:Fe-S cluster assembly ATPase SufC
VLIDGRIACSGGPELALELESKGYQGFKPEIEPASV